MFKFIVFTGLFITFCYAAFPKIIWMFETRGFNNKDNKFIQLCTKNIQYYAQKDDWEIRKVTPQNMIQYVYDIPQFLHYYRKMQEQHFEIHKLSDFFRINVLQHYGGVWLDVSNILVESLEWLNHLHENPDISNKHGKQPQFFSPYMKRKEGTQQIEMLDNGQVVLLNPGIESYMMAAMPHSQFLIQTIKYFKLRINDPHSLDVLLISFNIDLRPFCSHLTYPLLCGHYLSLNQCFQLAIQNKQHQLDVVRQKGELRKYACHQFGMWSIMSKLGPFIFEDKIIFFNTFQIVHYFIKASIPSIEKQFKKLKYFLKLPHIDSDLLEQFLIVPQRPFYQVQKSSLFSRYACPQLNFFVTDSIVNTYLLSRDPEYQKTVRLQKHQKVLICDISKASLPSALIFIVLIFVAFFVVILYLAYHFHPYKNNGLKKKIIHINNFQKIPNADLAEDS